MNEWMNEWEALTYTQQLHRHWRLSIGGTEDRAPVQEIRRDECRVSCSVCPNQHHVHRVTKGQHGGGISHFTGITLATRKTETDAFYYLFMLRLQATVVMFADWAVLINTNLEYTARLNIIGAVIYLDHLCVLLEESLPVSLVHRHRAQVWSESAGCGSEGRVWR